MIKERFNTIISILHKIKELELSLSALAITGGQAKPIDIAVKRIAIIREKAKFEFSLKDFYVGEVNICRGLVVGKLDKDDLKDWLSSVKNEYKPRLQNTPMGNKYRCGGDDKEPDGGFLTFILAVLVFCKKHKVSFDVGLMMVDPNDVLLGIATEFDVLTTWKSTLKTMTF